jgi:ATP-dependent RNA helicase DDX20
MLTRTVDVQTDGSFERLFLPEPILQGLHRAGFAKPSPVQLEAIPVGRCGAGTFFQLEMFFI